MKNNVSAVYVQFKCVLEKVLVEFEHEAWGVVAVFQIWCNGIARIPLDWMGTHSANSRIHMTNPLCLCRQEVVLMIMSWQEVIYFDLTEWLRAYRSPTCIPLCPHHQRLSFPSSSCFWKITFKIITSEHSRLNWWVSVPSGTVQHSCYDQNRSFPGFGSSLTSKRNPQLTEFCLLTWSKFQIVFHQADNWCSHKHQCSFICWLMSNKTECASLLRCHCSQENLTLTKETYSSPSHGSLNTFSLVMSEINNTGLNWHPFPQVICRVMVPHCVDSQVAKVETWQREVNVWQYET